jgi:aspartate 1-decarboxylase
MQLTLLKSKIQSVIVTEAKLEYRGSITIDADLMEAAKLKRYEAVHVNNATNGSRIITYVIAGERGSGQVCLNGAAALHFKKGDAVHVLSYASFDEKEADTFIPVVIHTNEKNKITEISNY